MCFFNLINVTGRLFEHKHIFRLNLYSSAFLFGCHDVLEIFLSRLLTDCQMELLILKYLGCQLISLTDNKETDNYTASVLSPTQSQQFQNLHSHVSHGILKQHQV